MPVASNVVYRDGIRLTVPHFEAGSGGADFRDHSSLL
jgi:hypothetical protein